MDGLILGELLCRFVRLVLRWDYELAEVRSSSVCRLLSLSAELAYERTGY